MQRKNTLITLTSLFCSALMVLIGATDNFWVSLIGMVLFYFTSEICLKFSFTIISEYFNDRINLLIVKITNIVMGLTTGILCLIIGAMYFAFRENNTRAERMQMSFFPLATCMYFLSFINGCVCSILIYRKKNQGRQSTK